MIWKKFGFLYKMALKAYLVFLFARPHNSLKEKKKKKKKKKRLAEKDLSWPSLDF